MTWLLDIEGAAHMPEVWQELPHGGMGLAQQLQRARRRIARCASSVSPRIPQLARVNAIAEMT